MVEDKYSCFCHNCNLLVVVLSFTTLLLRFCCIPRGGDNGEKENASVIGRGPLINSVINVDIATGVINVDIATAATIVLFTM